MTSNRCTGCGHPVRPSANFCEACGAAIAGRPATPSVGRPTSLPELPSVPAATPPTAPPSPSSPPDPRKRPSSLPEAGASGAAPVGVGWRPTGGRTALPQTPGGSLRAAAPAVAALFSKTKIVGYVRGLSGRMMQNQQVYSFRVETFDAKGNRLPPITVEMKGIGFEGSLNEGDQVEIDKKPSPGKLIRVSKVRNITAGSTFTVKEAPIFERALQFPLNLLNWILTAAFVIGFFAVLFWILSEVF